MSDWTVFFFFFTPYCNLIWWSFNFSYRSSILSCSQWPLDGSEKPNPQRYQRPGSQSQCTGSGLPPRHEQHAPGARRLRGIGRSRQTAGVRAARQTVRLQDGDRTWQQAWWHSGASLEVNVTSAFVWLQSVNPPIWLKTENAFHYNSKVRFSELMFNYTIGITTVKPNFQLRKQEKLRLPQEFNMAINIEWQLCMTAFNSHFALFMCY